ncbi:MAG: DUF2061 domain-containing protein [Burkholderiaceae bacterium]
MVELKTASFACVHFTVAFTVAFIITGSWVIGGLLALVEPLVNTVAFYIHERMWLKVAAKHPATA